MEQALPNALGAVTADGVRQRVLDAMDERGPELVSALGRAVPFLMRRSVPISFEAAKFASPREIEAELGQYVETMPLATDPGGSRALLCFEARTSGLLLNGALGGSIDEDDPQSALTNPQRAVIGQAADAIVKRFSDVLSQTGMGLKRLPPRAQIPPDTQLATIILRIGKDKPRRVAFAIAREALQVVASGQLAPQRNAGPSARVPAVLSQVEVELRVELGRVRRRLAEVEALRVGDILRLDTAVAGTVVVRVEDQHVLYARPTSRGTQLAITIADPPQAAPSIQVREVVSEPVRHIDAFVSVPAA